MSNVAKIITCIILAVLLVGGGILSGIIIERTRNSASVRSHRNRELLLGSSLATERAIRKEFERLYFEVRKGNTELTDSLKRAKAEIRVLSSIAGKITATTKDISRTAKRIREGIQEAIQTIKRPEGP